MKERPILFSAPMVRAILGGSKKQTRRAMKRQPHEDWQPAHYTELHGFDKDGELTPDKVVGWGAVNEDGNQGYVCPYGQPGDRLWVRESWHQRGKWLLPGWPEVDADDAYWNGSREIVYAADAKRPGHDWRSRPSIHMPRWASRILLEIVSVRVERLHDISTEDICTEGLSTTMREFDAECDLHEQWRQLWEAINGAENYDSNPWVWVIEFKRVLP